MIDFRPEVIKNMQKNCLVNEVKNVESNLVNLNEFDLYTKKFEVVISTNLFGEGFDGKNILNIWRKLLKVGGSSYLIIPDKKESIK